jgi:dCTP deaminase
MIKSDKWILEQCELNELLKPFNSSLVRKKEDDPKVSFGPSSYGYDIRLNTQFKIFSNSNQSGEAGIVDPKNFNENNFVEYDTDENEHNYVIVPPNSFVLGVSKEFIKIPRNVTALVMNKSTYARCGLNCFTTVIEAGWQGNLVLEYSNNTPLPIKLYANEGCAQLLFFESDEDCNTSYADRDGKYQNQTGVQTPIC